MLTIAAYLLESPQLDGDALRARRDAVVDAVSAWLSSKKVANPNAATGEFKSLTHGFPDGRFIRETVEAAGGYLQQTTLTEASGKGQNIETRVNIVSWNRRISVHVRVNVYNVTTILTPAHIVPKCPKIVKSLLKAQPDWLLSGEPVPAGSPKGCFGDGGGRFVADELLSSTRTVPIVLISQYDGEVLWDELPGHLATELAGLAHVIVIDQEAARVVEIEVGRENRCSAGAVRLYWPRDWKHGSESRLNSILWRVATLIERFDFDDRGSQRFSEYVREKVMEVAALTVTPPAAIRLIQNAAANAYIEDLRSRHDGRVDPETVQIVELYASQNQDLRSELEQVKETLAITSAQYESAQYALQQFNNRPAAAKRTLAGTDDQGNDEDTLNAPREGDVRFFKKTGSSGPYDRMVVFGGCNHTAWETIGNAPKALKGLQRANEDNSNWKRIEKCLTCTGGGVWRVTW